MSVMEATTIDMSAMLMKAYELGDLINGSEPIAAYLFWKNRMNEDTEAQSLIRRFVRKKEKFEECERFGHFHPDYHEALGEIELVQREMEENEAIRHFREAEQRVEELLHTVSKTIAFAVSDTIKVPGGDVPEASGCSTGGCSGGCSSCG